MTEVKSRRWRLWVRVRRKEAEEADLLHTGEMEEIDVMERTESQIQIPDPGPKSQRVHNKTQNLLIPTIFSLQYFRLLYS